VTPGFAASQGLQIIKNWAMSVIPAKSYPYYVLVIAHGNFLRNGKFWKGGKRFSSALILTYWLRE
jgi:hypothetical protein